MIALQFIGLILFLLMIFKPGWYIKSTSTKREKAKKEFRIIGAMGAFGCLLILLAKILFSH
jgi:hypothetical protein